MKFPDINQYITLLFSLLVEFSHTEPNLPARGSVPRVLPRAPMTVVRARLIPNGTWRGKPLSWPVARGPVPRDRSTYAQTARQPKPFPSRSRHGEGQALALR